MVGDVILVIGKKKTGVLRRGGVTVRPRHTPITKRET